MLRKVYLEVSHETAASGRRHGDNERIIRRWILGKYEPGLGDSAVQRSRQVLRRMCFRAFL